MSTDKLIKEIILKFKSEGSDNIKKAAESMSKSFNSKEVDKFVKSMESLNQKFGRAGVGMSTEMKKVTEYFKELNNQQFGKAEKNLDRLGRLINRQIENLDKLKREGASAEMISQRQSTLNRSANAFESLAGNTPAPASSGVRNFLNRASNGMGGRFSAGMGALNIAGSVFGAISTGAGMYKQYQMGEIQNRVTVAERFKQQAFDVFNGNLERATLYSDPKRAAQIQSRSSSLNKWSDIGMGAAGIGGGFGLAAGGLAMAAGGIAMAPLALAAGGAYGLYKGAQYYMGGGKEAQRAQSMQAAETEAKASTLDTEYYNYMAQRAPQRYQYQRQLQMGDNDALGFRQVMRNAGVMDEGQMSSIAMNFKRFGTSNAANMGMNAAGMAKNFGQDVNQTSAMLSQIALTNRGGAKSASEDLRRLFSEGVKAGIDDSALLEEYQKQSSAVMDLFKGRLSAGDAAGIFNQYTAGTDSRSLAAAGQAMSNYGKTIGGVSPLMQAKKTANMLDLAGGDFLTFQTLNRMSDTQLANMSDDQLSELGINKEKFQTFSKNQVQGTWGSATNKASVDSILQKARASGKLDEGDKNKLYMATTGQNAYDVDPSVVDATLKKALDITGNSDIAVSYKGASGAKPTEEGVLSSIAANTTGTTAGKQVGATASGQNTLDVQAQKYFNDNMQNIMTVFKAQSEQVMKSVESGDISKSISGISTAADEIAGAMLRAADKIDGGSRFSSSVSQSSSKKPGE